MNVGVVCGHNDMDANTEYDAVLKQLHSPCGTACDYRLSEQPLKKYRKDQVVPFKTRLVGTLERMQREGGHSSELLESISNLIGEGNE